MDGIKKRLVYALRYTSVIKYHENTNHININKPNKTKQQKK